MSWPISQDYNEAIQNPGSSFADPELRAGEAVTNALGLPMPRTGNFADVYEFNGGSGVKWAIKCFTREITGLQERYRKISAHLKQANLPFMVDFTYLEKGIRVGGQWFPVLKMQWVEGFTLNEFVRKQIDKPQILDVLSTLWLKLAVRLQEAQVAHCDLQHGNVLLVPGSRASSLAVKLVDYDGMCVPSLTGLTSGELGHPNFQHPQRAKDGIYNLEGDRFSHLVIYTALRALLWGKKDLWQKYDNGDNLLFKMADFSNPDGSKLFSDLVQSGEPTVQFLGKTLALSLAAPMDKAPLLSEVPGISVPEKKTTEAGPKRRTQVLVENKGAAPVYPSAASPFADLEEPVETSITSRPKKKKAMAGLVWSVSSLAVLFLALMGWFAFGKNGKAPSQPQPRDTSPKIALKQKEDASRVTTVKEAPAKENPVEENPVKKDPVKKDPVKKDPVKKDPVREDPVTEDPGKEAPVNEKPNPDAQKAELLLLAQLITDPARSRQIREEGLNQLNQNKHINHLNLQNTGITDAALQHVGALTTLVSLQLGDTKISNAGLKELRGLKKLQYLNLEGTQVTNAGFAELNKLPQLQKLVVGGPQVSDANLIDLKGLPALRSLTLTRGARVTGVGLKEFTRITNLNLGGSDLSAKGFEEICRLHNLTSLQLSGLNIEEYGASQLQQLANLQILQLDRTKITDVSLQALRPLTRLSYLNLSSTKVTSIAELKHLRALQHLVLNGTKVTDAGLRGLNELENLTGLQLQGTKITDNGLREIKDLRNLRYLNLNSNKVTDAGLTELRELRQLQTLILSGSDITDAGVGNLKELKNLNGLHLYQTKLTDRGLSDLEELRNLRYLNIQGANVSNEAVTKLRNACPGLQVVR